MRACHAQLGPGQGACGNHGLKQRACLRVAAQPQQQFGANACGVKPIRLACFKALSAQGGGRFKVFLLNGIEDRLEVDFAQPGQAQPLEQRAGGEGFEQIAVQRRLGGFRHCGIRGLGGDHEKHGGKGQQLCAAQVVQQGLARVVGLGEILLAQHVVEHRVLQPASGVAHPAALNHLGHPVFTQLGHQNAA